MVRQARRRCVKYILPKNNHTFKIGGEWRAERYPGTFFTGTAGEYGFSALNGPLSFGSATPTYSTSQIALQDQPAPSSGSFGFAFASFLIGDVTAVSLACRTAVFVPANSSAACTFRTPGKSRAG